MSNNPLEEGTVGSTGNTLVTNFAYINVQIGEYRITNLPINNDGMSDSSGDMGRIDHNLSSSGFNSYVKSFTCKRAVPKAVKGFWSQNGGSIEATLTVFDPTFVQFEEMIMESIKTQRVYCSITYGLSQRGEGAMPEPFRMTCLITSVNQTFNATGVEWTLSLGTVPPEFFSDYPEKGKDNKKETVITIGSNGMYHSVGEAVEKLLASENWHGVVISTKIWTKKLTKIPTKDYTSKIQLVKDKLASMAVCADSDIVDKYHLLTTLDGAVFFIPFGMTVKSALQHPCAIPFGGYKLQDGLKAEIDVKSTIEQLNMSKYIQENDGVLTLKYGFQNSIVQDFSLTFDPLPMITQFVYTFEWYPENVKHDKKNVKTFSFPEIKDKDKKNKEKKVKEVRVFLHDNNEEDAKQTAKTIVRKLQILDYKGSATLINWPYLSAMQQIRFEYLIPNGARIAKKVSNVNHSACLESDDKNKQSIQNVNVSIADKKFQEATQASQLLMRGANNKNIISDSNIFSEKEKNQGLVYASSMETKKKSRRAKGLKAPEDSHSAIEESQFKTNMNLPTTLGAWTDTRGGSITYLITSITDTIESGILTSELELSALFSNDFPQIKQSLKE